MSLRPTPLLLGLLLAAPPLAAQVPDSLPPRDTLPATDTLAVPLPPADTVPEDSARALRRAARAAAAPAVGTRFVVLASGEDDRLRLRQLLGAEGTAGYLVRSPSTLRPFAAGGGGLRVDWVAPRVESVWNSGLPWTFNDGPLWAGRGASAQLTAGVRLAAGPLSLTLAPQLVYEANADYDVVFYPNPDQRSPFADPWHTNPESLDVPTRFGDEAHTFVDPGQSALTLDLGPAAIGFATENEWWGPGIRNAIVLSSHAAGVPRAFLRTDRPLRTFAGDFEGRILLGLLDESDYFDYDESNDHRSLSAVALTWQPRFDRRLTLGYARGVYQVARSVDDVLSHAFNFVRRVGRPNAVSPFEPGRPRKPDQVYSFFGRYVLPDDGLEAYAEWARTEAPADLRELLLFPNHTQGYTVGVQWARPVGGSGVLRLQTELSNLEQNNSYRQFRPIGFYNSRPVPQGYTQEGQVLGAAIGHGSSSQWLAADYLGRRWALGAFAGRIRWQTDAYYSARPPSEFAYDVSVWAGVRGGVELPWARVDAEASTGNRYNYLFQFDYDPVTFHGIDVRNHSLKLTVTTLAR
jgi:hypothetical protein